MFNLFNLLASVDFFTSIHKPDGTVIVLELLPFTKEIKRLSEFYLKKKKNPEWMKKEQSSRI